MITTLNLFVYSTKVPIFLVLLFGRNPSLKFLTRAALVLEPHFVLLSVPRAEIRKLLRLRKFASFLKPAIESDARTIPYWYERVRKSTKVKQST